MTKKYNNENNVKVNKREENEVVINKFNKSNRFSNKHQKYTLNINFIFLLKMMLKQIILNNTFCTFNFFYI